jgi:hypothetical protein
MNTQIDFFYDFFSHSLSIMKSALSATLKVSFLCSPLLQLTYVRSIITNHSADSDSDADLLVVVIVEDDDLDEVDAGHNYGGEEAEPEPRTRNLCTSSTNFLLAFL